MLYFLVRLGRRPDKLVSPRHRLPHSPNVEDTISRGMEMPEKCCRTCKLLKPHAAFPLSPRFGGIRSPSCQECIEHKQRQQQRLRISRQQLRKHKLDPDVYLAMRAEQEDCCAICGTHETLLPNVVGTWKRLVIDHDHITGRIRGLLCQHCNRALGSFHDSIPTLRNAIRYLQGKHRRRESDIPQIPLFDTGKET